MKSFAYTIKDSEGVHARPAGMLGKTCKAMKPTKVTLTRGDETADCTKIFAIMGLGIKCGEEVTITVEGPDEDTAAAQLQEFMAANL